MSKTEIPKQSWCMIYSSLCELNTVEATDDDEGIWIDCTVVKTLYGKDMNGHNWGFYYPSDDLFLDESEAIKEYVKWLKDLIDDFENCLIEHKDILSEVQGDQKG